MPLIWTAGADCPNGLGYQEITASFRMPKGVYVVAVVEAGSDCAASPKTAAQEIGGDAVVDVYLLGDGESAATLKTFVETQPESMVASLLRMVQGALGEGPMDLGFSESTTYPSSIVSKIFEGVVAGETAMPGATGGYSTDERGYVSLQMGDSNLRLGAASAGADDVVVMKDCKVVLHDGTTVYVTGRRGDKDFPIELFSCTESASDGFWADCGPRQMTAMLRNLADRIGRKARR